VTHKANSNRLEILGATKRTALLNELKVAGISINGCGPVKWMGEGEKRVRFEL
jgi:hypothetical protein